MKNTWKKALAGLAALILVAGAMPANVGGFLTKSTGIVACAAETTVTWTQNDLLNTFFGSFTKQGITLTSSSNDARSGNNFYENGTNTFSVANGKIKKIEIINNYSDMNGWTVETVGSYQPYPEAPDYWAYIYKHTWTGEAAAVTIQDYVPGIESIVFTIEESAATDISSATVNLNVDNTVASIAIGDNTITDLLGFDITYGKSDDSHTATTVPTAPDTYYAYVTPKSNNTAYTGTAKSAAFVVTTDLSQADVEILGTYVYDGTPKTVDFTVKVDGNEISKDDLTITGDTSAAAPGIYTVTISGKDSNYENSKTFTWEIEKATDFAVKAENAEILTAPDAETGKYAAETLVTAVGNTKNGYWFDNKTKKVVCTERRYTFYVIDVVDVKWVADETVNAYEDGIANVTISDRAPIAGGKTRVTVTSTWRLPKGAKITKAGTYRVYRTWHEDEPTQEDMLNTTFAQSKLKTINGTYYFDINMKPETAAKNLYTMTYVQYELDEKTYEIMSDVVCSSPSIIG